MVIASGHNVAPHQRQNRRRERPGSRTRRTIPNTRKSHLQSCIEADCQLGIQEAHDSSFYLPSDKTKPSPLLRENFDQSWQRWKARKVEEEAVAEIAKLQLEQEQIKLFGGDVNDDELYRMGILYDEDGAHGENPVARDLPLEHAAPAFVIRQGKPRPLHRSKCSPLPLYLSFTDFSTDADIARFLSASLSNSHKRTIQHRRASFSPIIMDIPQSLPLSSSLSPRIPLSPALDCNSENWTFINTTHTTGASTPCSEPETWILCDDS